MAEGRAIRLSREVQLADELAGVRAALSACQEQLDRLTKTNEQNAREGARLQQAGGQAALLAHDAVKRAEAAETALSACQEEKRKAWEARDVELRECQEELARVNAFAAELAQDATDALVARDELARLARNYQLNPLDEDREIRLNRAIDHLSSEATKGDDGRIEHDRRGWRGQP